jgi:predicted permease
MGSQGNRVTALWDDARFALRTLRKNAGFTAVVLLTLAVGIGANAAIFGLMDQVMLRPLPVRDPDRLVVVDAPGTYSGHTSNGSDTLTPLSHPMFEGLRDRAPGFAAVLAFRGAQVHLSTGQATESLTADLVSGTYFPALGLQPSLGRLLGPEDDRTPSGHPIVVLGERLFRTRFGGDPGVVGRVLRLNGHPMTVVGVAPAGFEGLEVGQLTDLFVPLAMEPQVLPTWRPVLGNWRSRWLTVMARLQDGETPASAEAGANVVYAQLLQEDVKDATNLTPRYREQFLAKRLRLLPGARGTSALRDDARGPLVVLMGMVGLVLMIACANVANLVLARGSSRQKELAVRTALGAGRGRLVRQLVVESLLLSLAGGALGLVLSIWMGQALIAALPLDRAAHAFSAEPHLRVGLFALALSVVTGLAFGVLPALQATGRSIVSTLKNEAAAVVGGAASSRFRRGLVVAQIALSLLLLVGAGLFTRSLANLRALDPGFRPEHLATFRVDPALSGYEPEKRHAVFERLRATLAAEPGVEAVSMSAVALMDGSDSSSTILVEGYAAKEDEDMSPNFNWVGPGFFETVGMPVVRGRDITEADRRDAAKVAVVNETFARYYFGDQDPIGRRFGRARFQTIDTEIVGVVKDGKSASLREKPLRFVYAAVAQQDSPGEVTFYLRTAGDQDALLGRLPALVRGIDPGLPVTQTRTMRAQIGQSLYVDRMVATLSAAFGLVATLLAALGLYGVMAYAVSRRTREIGIRMALGAERADVMRMVFRDVALLVAAGLALGLPGGYGLGRAIESQLFGLQARDPLTFSIATVALLLAATVAAYLPARRATRVDPLVALRSE